MNSVQTSELIAKIREELIREQEKKKGSGHVEGDKMKEKRAVADYLIDQMKNHADMYSKLSDFKVPLDIWWRSKGKEGKSQNAFIKEIYSLADEFEDFRQAYDQFSAAKKACNKNKVKKNIRCQLCKNKMLVTPSGQQVIQMIDVLKDFGKNIDVMKDAKDQFIQRLNILQESLMSGPRTTETSDQCDEDEDQVNNQIFDQLKNEEMSTPFPSQESRRENIPVRTESKLSEKIRQKAESETKRLQMEMNYQDSNDTNNDVIVCEEETKQ